MTINPQKPIADVLFDLPFCGCRSGTNYEIVLLLLQRAADKMSQWGTPESGDTPSFYDPCEDASARWVEFGAHILACEGLLEHGTSVGYAWLSNTGKDALTFLREHGTDPEKWPDAKVLG